MKPELFCDIGDIVEFVKDVTTSPWPGEQPEVIKKGSQYRVSELIGEGWDLERKTGSGPNSVRILNSEMSKYIKLVEV